MVMQSERCGSPICDLIQSPTYNWPFILRLQMAPVTKSITILAAALMVVGCASQDPASSAAATSAAGDLKTAAAKVPLAAAEIQVVTAQFGVFGADPSGQTAAVRNGQVSRDTRRALRLVHSFKTSKPTVVWRGI